MNDISEQNVVLSVSGLTRRFGETLAVDDLSFEIRRGEVFGLLGPNGAGKTTTLGMICGLLKPDSGEIRVNGVCASGPQLKGMCSFGVCPQNIVVWETLTCREQLMFMGEMYGVKCATARKRADELLDRFGLGEKRSKLAKTLSGGMQRRLNFALALVHDPEIVFLDEPQAGLDPQSRVLVRDYIRDLAGEKTIVLTTHDMEEAEKLSDRVCIIDRGKLLVLDTVQAIKNRLGQGDFFEVELTEGLESRLMPRLSALTDRIETFSIRDGVLQLVSDTAAEWLPRVLEVIRQEGLHLENLRVRKKTLEDVFISLTGRGLRE